MTGGEIIAAGKAVGAIGKQALGEDEQTKDVLLRVGADTPEMADAARSRAARVAVKERLKLLAYRPLAWLGIVSDEYFKDSFERDITPKLDSIPDENLISPPPQISVPVIQGLSYTHEDPNLKELFLNLLTAASDDRRVGQTHPGFAEVIKQLAPNEAKLLILILENNGTVAARVKELLGKNASFRVLTSHLMPMNATTGEPQEDAQTPIWVDNWQRLGLVEVTYMEYSSDENAYDWVKSRPEYVRLTEQPGIGDIDFDKGLIRATNFGRQFHSSVT